MLRRLIWDEMQEIIKSEDKIEEPKQETGDENRNFHRKNYPISNAQSTTNIHQHP